MERDHDTGLVEFLLAHGITLYVLADGISFGMRGGWAKRCEDDCENSRESSRQNSCHV
jgi:hypothetical protein